MFETSPFSSIWLEIFINWHTKTQGPFFNGGGFIAVLPTPLVIRVILLHKTSGLCNPFYPVLDVYTVKSWIEGVLLFNFWISERASIQEKNNFM